MLLTVTYFRCTISEKISNYIVLTSEFMYFTCYNLFFWILLSFLLTLTKLHSADCTGLKTHHVTTTNSFYLSPRITLQLIYPILHMRTQHLPHGSHDVTRSSHDYDSPTGYRRGLLNDVCSIGGVVCFSEHVNLRHLHTSTKPVPHLLQFK